MSPSKEIKPNVFARILRDQLRVSRDEFWAAIRTGQPVNRPVELDPPPAEYEAWVVTGLSKHGYDEDRVRAMTPEEAKARLLEIWSSPQEQ
jgi:hypothetical protein